MGCQGKLAIHYWRKPLDGRHADVHRRLLRQAHTCVQRSLREYWHSCGHGVHMPSLVFNAGTSPATFYDTSGDSGTTHWICLTFSSSPPGAMQHPMSATLTVRMSTMQLKEAI